MATNLENLYKLYEMLDNAKENNLPTSEIVAQILFMESFLILD